METKKIAKLLGDADNESSKFATRKWHVINHLNNTGYGAGNENDEIIKFETKVIKSYLCDYSDTYINITGDITVDRNNNDVEAAFKNLAPFTKCVTRIKHEHIDSASYLHITMRIYNLSNTVKTIQILHEVCGNLKEMNHM